jgi:hypothetical protein
MLRHEETSVGRFPAIDINSHRLWWREHVQYDHASSTSAARGKR